MRLPKEGLYWLLASGVLLAGGWFRGMNLVVLLAYIMFAIWITNFILAGRGLRRLHCKRHIHGPVFAETPFAVQVTVRNPGRRAVNGVRLEERRSAHGTNWFLTRVPARTEVRRERELTLPSRGRHRRNPLWASSGYPFGLTRREFQVVGNEEVIVLPRLGRLHRGGLRRLLNQTSPSVGTVRKQLRRHPMARNEFHGLRAFRSGDSPHLIHWRTSARCGELMVREFEDAPTDALVVILDPWMPPESERVRESERESAAAVRAPGEALSLSHSATLSRLEEAVSLAATICWEWCRQSGDRLVLAIAGDPPVIIDGETNRAHRLRLSEQLALVQGRAQVDSGRLLNALVECELPASPVLVVSTRPSNLADLVAARLHRPVASIGAWDLGVWDFYESPWAATAPTLKTAEASSGARPPAAV